MTSDSQFRPPPPPALGSPAYAAAVQQVERLGAHDSRSRTAEQTATAMFWDDGAGTVTPPGHWNQIAAQVALARHTSLAQNARLFALLDMALADAGIVAWDAKYAFRFWRPITAIRQAGLDPNWTPLLATQPFPSYISGHSTFSGAAAAVLTGVFGPHVRFTISSDTLPGVRRSFGSFWAAARQAGRSRILGGIHYSFDNRAGLAAGRALGRYVVQTMLVPDRPGGRRSSDPAGQPGAEAPRAPSGEPKTRSRIVVDDHRATDGLEEGLDLV